MRTDYAPHGVLTNHEASVHSAMAFASSRVVDQVLAQGFGFPAEAQPRQYKVKDDPFVPSIPSEDVLNRDQDNAAIQAGNIAVDVAHQADRYYGQYFRANHLTEIKHRQRFMAGAYLGSTALLVATGAIIASGGTENNGAETLTGISSLGLAFMATFMIGTVKRGLERRNRETTPGTPEQRKRDQKIRDLAQERFSS